MYLLFLPLRSYYIPSRTVSVRRYFSRKKKKSQCQMSLGIMNPIVRRRDGLTRRRPKFDPGLFNSECVRRENKLNAHFEDILKIF